MSENKNINYGVCRYKNIGSTCYMNSILHILQQLPYFIEYIYNKKFEDNDNNLENSNKMLIYELYKLFKISLDNDNSIITPLGFKKFIGIKNEIWNDNNQQDSHDFLNFLLQTLKEEIQSNNEIIYGKNKIKYFVNNNISNITIINNIVASISEMRHKLNEYSCLSIIFDGIFETARKCAYCNSISKKYENYSTLCLTIPNKYDNITIYDCLDELTSEEILSFDNMVNCNLCGLKTRAINKLLLWKTPKILIIQIKRFKYNNQNNTSEKITSNVEYPIHNLDLNKYFNNSSPYKNKNKYNLIGINIHLGDCRNGHYISIIKNKLNNKWYLYNDEHPIKEINCEKDLQVSNAYLLFYICI
uniref:USP domain-containing protein n=1 Tax=viral metagenome TaxID=1070528 RepID=A0A6C0EDF7_9ZZZZ